MVSRRFFARAELPGENAPTPSRECSLRNDLLGEKLPVMATNQYRIMVFFACNSKARHHNKRMLRARLGQI